MCGASGAPAGLVGVAGQRRSWPRSRQCRQEGTGTGRGRGPGAIAERSRRPPSRAYHGDALTATSHFRRGVAEARRRGAPCKGGGAAEIGSWRCDVPPLAGAAGGRRDRRASEILIGYRAGRRERGLFGRAEAAGGSAGGRRRR